MHFGRTENLEGITPILPPDSIRTEKFLALPHEAHTQIYIGCPIWASKEWVGDLYPSKTKPSDFLKTYAQVFNTVELNSSFYHLPIKERVEEWRQQTPEGFRFCPKVYRGITENLGASEMPALVLKFCETILHFGSRLGLAFAQFSEHFGPKQMPLLEKFLTVWPQTVPLAVELRHPDWFLRHALPDALVNLFYRKKVASLITDTVGRRDVLHFSLTQPKVLIRFQGNEGHSLDTQRLKEWAHRIQKWKEHGLSEIYFFTHQPGDKNIPQTARLAVREITGIEVPEMQKQELSKAEQMEML